MNKIVIRLVKAGLMLDMKNLFLELRAPKLKPIKADKGMQGVRIFNWKAAIDLDSGLRFGPIMSIKKPELKNIIIPNKKNKKVNLILTFVRTSPLSLLFRGVMTATTALCNGPFMPPIIIIKKPGIM